jgi:hypothetical protein
MLDMCVHQVLYRVPRLLALKVITAPPVVERPQYVLQGRTVLVYHLPRSRALEELIMKLAVKHK